MADTNKKNGKGRGFKKPRIEAPRDLSKITPLGQWSEKANQTTSRFFEEVHAALTPKYPKTACLLIGGVVVVPPAPIQPLAPPGIANSAVVRRWELTDLKVHTDSLNRYNKNLEDITLEEIKLASELKTHVTIGLNSRLHMMFAPTNPNHRVWATVETQLTSLFSCS